VSGGQEYASRNQKCGCQARVTGIGVHGKGVSGQFEGLTAFVIGLVEVAVDLLVPGEFHLGGIILGFLAEFVAAQGDII
jgi:hypothetical protein